MKKLFDINEDEKNRILEMHVSATKRHYLNEQIPKPKTPTTPTTPGYIYTQSVAMGSTDSGQIKGPGVLAQKGIPNVNQQNFNTTVFYTDFNGLIKTFMNRGKMSEFDEQSKRETKSPDSIVITYKDGTENVLDGQGTGRYLIQKISSIGGSGNGLIAIYRAITDFSQKNPVNTENNQMKIPKELILTLSGERISGSLTYNSGVINKIEPELTSILAWSMYPVIKNRGIKVNQSNAFKPAVLRESYYANVSSFIAPIVYRSYIPKNVDPKEWGVNPDINNLIDKISSITGNESDDELKIFWDSFQNEIIERLKTEVTSFLKKMFPNDWQSKLKQINPQKIKWSPSEFLDYITDKTVSGTSSSRQGSAIQQTTQKRKVGQ